MRQRTANKEYGEKEMVLKPEIGTNQAELCEAILKTVCRVIKEAFPDDAAEVIKAIVQITL